VSLPPRIYDTVRVTSSFVGLYASHGTDGWAVEWKLSQQRLDCLRSQILILRSVLVTNKLPWWGQDGLQNIRYGTISNLNGMLHLELCECIASTPRTAPSFSPWHWYRYNVRASGKDFTSASTASCHATRHIFSSWWFRTAHYPYINWAKARSPSRSYVSPHCAILVPHPSNCLRSNAYYGFA